MRAYFYDTSIEVPHPVKFPELIVRLAAECPEFERSCLDEGARIKPNVVVLIDNEPVEIGQDAGIATAESVEFILQLAGG